MQPTIPRDPFPILTDLARLGCSNGKAFQPKMTICLRTLDFVCKLKIKSSLCGGKVNREFARPYRSYLSSSGKT